MTNKAAKLSIVMLIPVSDLPLPHVAYENPEIIQCPAGCGREVWISDKKRAYIAAGSVALCAVCCMDIYGPIDKVTDITKPN